MADTPVDPGRLSIANMNCSMAYTPFPVTMMRPFVPTNSVSRNEPFVARNLWKGAVNSIKALKRLKLAVGNSKKLRSDLVIVTAHTHGHLMIWNAEDYTVMNAVQHYNSVTITTFVVTNTRIYTLVEKDPKVGKSGDDVDVYVWDLNTFELATQLSGHDERVSAIAVDDDDVHVVTGSVDKSILVWDMKKLPTPVGRLLGHQMMVTQLLLGGKYLVSGSSDSAVRVWNMDTMTCLHCLEGHQGSIGVLRWVVSPYSEAPPGGTQSDVGYFLSACASGLVRFTSLNPANGEVLNLWNNKAHKALVTDACWDGDLVVTASAADGLNFYNMATKSNARMGFGDSGVRQLALDPARKLLIAGTDAGQVTVVSYEGLLGSNGDSDSLHMVATLQPHLGSITSIVLERAQNGVWERIVTTSNDHTLFVIDLDPNRGARTYNGLGTRNVAQIVQTGSVITVAENNCQVWDPFEQTPKTGANRVLEGHSKRVVSVRYSAEWQKLITGGDDGFVRTWDVLLYSTESEELAHDEVIESADVIDMTQPVRTVSEPSEHLVAVGTQKPNSKAGTVAVINFDRGTAAVPAIPTFIYPVYCCLLVHDPGHNKPHHITVLAQLRSGEILLCGGTDGGAFAAFRSILREQVPYQFDRDQDFPPPIPVRARLNKGFYTPRVEVAAVDGDRNMKSFDVSTDSAETSTTVAFNATLDSPIVDFKPVSQADISLAVACENGNTYMLGSKGQVLVEVRYDGSVIETAAEALRPNRRHRSFMKVQETQGGPLAPKSPACSCVAVNNNARVIVVGYRDGVIQLYDLSQKFVCRRIHAHSTAVQRCWILPDELRLVSSSVAGTLRYDTIYLRNVREGPKDMHEAFQSSNPRYVEDRQAASGEGTEATHAGPRKHVVNLPSNV